MEGEERFYLFIYGALPTVSTRPDPLDMAGWLSDNATLVGETLEFKPQHLTKFFKSLYQSIEIDLFILLGSSCTEEVEEEDYCCGSLGPVALKQAKEELDYFLKNEREKGATIASNNGLDPTFFLQSAYTLSINFEKVLELSPDATALGYLE